MGATTARRRHAAVGRRGRRLQRPVEPIPTTCASSTASCATPRAPPTDGFSLTGMAYTNKWNSTDQVPLRAITSGQIGRFDAEDPSDGGNTEPLLAVGAARADRRRRIVEGQRLCDQERRSICSTTSPISSPIRSRATSSISTTTASSTGANASRTFNGSFAGLPTETTFGIQTRYDDIDLGADRHLPAHVPVEYPQRQGAGGQRRASTPRTRCTGPGGCAPRSAGAATSMRRTSTRSSTPPIPGSARAAIGSPKFRMVLGPFYKTEFFFAAGMGMHSNDVRGATITEDPHRSRPPRSAPSPLLVRTKGAEVGVRTRLMPGLDSSLSLFVLDQASELVFSGDAGDTSASRSSRRYRHRMDQQLSADLRGSRSTPISRCRMRAFSASTASRRRSMRRSRAFRRRRSATRPATTFPMRPAIVASAGITLGEKTGWFGALRWRYLGVDARSPRTTRSARRRPASSMPGSAIGFDNGWRVQLDLLNLLNARPTRSATPTAR